MKLVAAATFFWIISIIGISLKHWSGTLVCVALALSLAVLLQSGTLKFVLSLTTPIIVVIVSIGLLGGEYAPPTGTQYNNTAITIAGITIIAAIVIPIGFVLSKISQNLWDNPPLPPRSARAPFQIYNIVKIGDPSEIMDDLPEFNNLAGIKGCIEFHHPEGGSWSYGMTQDLSCVNGIAGIVSLGNWDYRAYFTRNPENGAKVLEAAYKWRTLPKPVEGGVVQLWKSPYYEILFQESERNLD